MEVNIAPEPDELGEDHDVPVDLVELYEMIEWNRAVDDEGR